MAQRVAAAGDGTRAPQFRRPPGVCGNGGHNITIVDDDEHEEWESDCTPGPVRVSLRVQRRAGGRCPHLRRRPVAPAARGRRPISGTVPARPGGADLLTLAERRRTGRRGAGHRGHAGRQRGRVARPSSGWRGGPTLAARDAAAGGLLARPGGGRRGDARARLDRRRRRRRARGAEAGGVRTVPTPGRRRRPGADPRSRARTRTAKSGRARSSGWARARTRERSRCSRKSSGRSARRR